MSKSFIPSEILERITWTKNGKLPGDPDYIKSISHTPQPCEDCGLIVENRRIQQRFHDSPQKHFRKKCLNCKKFYNPQTKQYDLNSQEVLAFFRKFFCDNDK